jgi:hemerythrin-like domain-containing protein
MLRDKNLVPLSRQHQHALALCVRIDRAIKRGDLDMLAWQAEIQQLFVSEVRAHFDAEERELFPVALRFAEMGRLVDELGSEHTVLREYFGLATERTMDPAKLHDFARKLSAHIRKEERQLFEGLQQVLSSAEFAKVGAALENALDGTGAASCAIPKRSSNSGRV